MNAANAMVDWWDLRAHPPVLCVQVPDLRWADIPFEYDLRGTFYFAEKDGFVNFFVWGGKLDDGYGGREFPIRMRDGRTVTLKGPWSGRTGVMNRAGFPPSMEAAFFPVPFSSGDAISGVIPGAITVIAAREIVAKFCPDATIVRFETADGEIRYELVLKEGRPKPGLPISHLLQHTIAIGDTWQRQEKKYAPANFFAWCDFGLI